MALFHACSLRFLVSLAAAVALTVSLAPTPVAARRSLLTDDEHNRRRDHEPLVREISEFCGAQRQCWLSHWKIESHSFGSWLGSLCYVSLSLRYGSALDDMSDCVLQMIDRHSIISPEEHNFLLKWIPVHQVVSCPSRLSAQEIIYSQQSGPNIVVFPVVAASVPCLCS
jgi:hypothetical protein